MMPTQEQKNEFAIFKYSQAHALVGRWADRVSVYSRATGKKRTHR